MPVHAKPLRVLLLCLAPSLGCDKLIEAVNQGAQAVAEDKTGGLTGGPKTDDDRLSEKLQPYIDCINGQSNNVNDSASRYFQWIPDAKAGPTGKESPLGLFEIRDIKPCVDGIAASADKEPDDTELETTAKAYSDALVAVEAVANPAYKYYDEENYKDDKWAKAKEMHPKLVSAFDAFTAADKAMRAAVATRNDALQERDLARVEAEMGKILMWHHKKTMLLAKKVMDTGDVAIEPTFALDLATFEPALTEFEAQLDAMNAYAKDHKEETDSLTMFSRLQSGCEDVKKAAKEMLRRKRDNTAFTKSDFERFATGPAEWVEGSPAKLSHAYNDLVNTSNGLNYNFYKPPAK